VTVAQSVRPTLVLANVSVAGIRLAEVVAAAVSGGFDAISVLGRTRRRALRDGLTDADMRAMIGDHGLRVTDVEAAGDWLSAPPTDGPAWMDPIYGWEDFIDIAHQLGASTLVAVHFGTPRSLAEAADAFGRLCDRAADQGLRVALEFPAWATIGDVGRAWDVVRESGRDNAGLLVDFWHHRRGGNDDAALRRVPGNRIFSVQVSDAAATPVGPPQEDVLHRRLPGAGELDPAGFLRTLWEMGVTAPLGVEVYDADLVAQGPEVVGPRLYAALRLAVDTAAGELLGAPPPPEG
jgi:sugar phosphate isomerase/epimerase